MAGVLAFAFSAAWEWCSPWRSTSFSASRSEALPTRRVTMSGRMLSRRFAGGRMLVQGLGLTFGASFVFLVGKTSSSTTLLVAMSLFGLCKGFYDSGIFASLFDTIEPRARGTAAGIMNTVGWGGGALGPLFVGLASQYGSKPSEVENMSEAIAWCSAIYLVAAALVATAIYYAGRRLGSQN